MRIIILTLLLGEYINLTFNYGINTYKLPVIREFLKIASLLYDISDFLVDFMF